MNVLGDRVLELGPKSDVDSPYKNFKLTRDTDGVAWLLFDREGTSANTLSADLIEELDKVLAELESQRPTGLVIRSAKTSSSVQSGCKRVRCRFPPVRALAWRSIATSSTSTNAAARRADRPPSQIRCPIH